MKLPVALKSLNVAKRTVHSKSQSALSVIDFSDNKTVFRFRQTRELMRSLAVLKICSVNKFVDNALNVMRWCETYLGSRLFGAIARPTFYRQFVGGDSEQELRDTFLSMREAGLKLMVCPAQEEDQGESSGDQKYVDNMKYITEIGKIMKRVGEEKPCLQFKVTAFMPADVLCSITDNIGNKTSLEEVATTVGDSFTSGKAVSLPYLTDHHNKQLNQGLELLGDFGRFGESQMLRLLVDAEYTYMNPGISAMALGMMLAYNGERPVVWNTYQCYLKAAMSTINTEMNIVHEHGRHFGAKIVRGAYMEKERKLAKEKGYADPVNDTYEATGLMYDSVAEHILHLIKSGTQPTVVFGSHNEASVRHIVFKMAELDLPPNCPHVNFGQIYGMAEQISVPLAAAGYNVYKSVPYGPLTEVLPYLSRRAAENRVVLAGARREQELLLKELKRRISFM